MATGVDHYREAEHLLEIAHHIARPDSGHSDAEATMLVGLALKRAQVHATLSLAAATALERYRGEEGMTEADRMAWYRAASEGPGEKQRVREARAAEAAEFAEDREQESTS